MKELRFQPRTFESFRALKIELGDRAFQLLLAEECYWQAYRVRVPPSGQGGSVGGPAAGSVCGEVRRPARRLPVAPLRQLLEDLPHSINSIARSCAQCNGKSCKTYEKTFRRILAGESKTITVEMADRVAMGMGRHPAEIWGLDW